MLIVRILARAGKMCDPAYAVQALTAMAALVLLLFSLFCHLSVGELTADTYPTYRLACELFRLPAGILLVGIIGAVCIEDIRGESA